MYSRRADPKPMLLGLDLIFANYVRFRMKINPINALLEMGYVHFQTFKLIKAKVFNYSNIGVAWDGRLNLYNNLQYIMIYIFIRREQASMMVLLETPLIWNSNSISLDYPRSKPCDRACSLLSIQYAVH